LHPRAQQHCDAADILEESHRRLTSLGEHDWSVDALYKAAVHLIDGYCLLRTGKEPTTDHERRGFLLLDGTSAHAWRDWETLWTFHNDFTEAGFVGYLGQRASDVYQKHFLPLKAHVRAAIDAFP